MSVGGTGRVADRSVRAAVERAARHRRAAAIRAARLPGAAARGVAARDAHRARRIASRSAGDPTAERRAGIDVLEADADRSIRRRAVRVVRARAHRDATDAAAGVLTRRDAALERGARAVGVGATAGTEHGLVGRARARVDGDAGIGSDARVARARRALDDQATGGASPADRVTADPVAVADTERLAARALGCRAGGEAIADDAVTTVARTRSGVPRCHVRCRTAHERERAAEHEHEDEAGCARACGGRHGVAAQQAASQRPCSLQSPFVADSTRFLPPPRVIASWRIHGACWPTNAPNFPCPVKTCSRFRL